ncbi:MAG: hypothetical protein AABP62_14415 [Planctomycetota bacterium]
MLLRFVVRVRRACLLALMLCLLTCGCFDSKPPGGMNTVTLPFQGQEVELLVPKGLGLPATWEVLLQEWSSQTGAAVRWTEYSDADEAKFGEGLAPTSSSGGRVVLFPLRRLSELDRHLAPLNPAAGSDFDAKDLFKGLRERVVSRERYPVAVPIAAPVLVCYYRRDLLKAAGLKPPANWEDYQTLLDGLEQWAPKLIAVEPLGPDHRAATFFARSLALAKHPENYSVWFDLETGEPVVQTPGFAEALVTAQRAWKRMPSSINEMTPADCRRAVIEGRAALALAYEPSSATESTSRVERAPEIEIGVTRLPGSKRVFNRNSNRWETSPAGSLHAPGLCGTMGLAAGVTLPAGGSKDIAAWNLLTTLVGSQFESAWATLPKTPCRESQIGTAPTWNNDGLTAEEAGQYVDAVAQMLRDTQLVAELPLPRADEFRAATARCISGILAGESEPDSALAAMQAEFVEIAKSVGKDSLRAAYRRGLGLSTPTALQRATSP